MKGTTELLCHWFNVETPMNDLSGALEGRLYFGISMMKQRVRAFHHLSALVKKFQRIKTMKNYHRKKQTE